MSQRGLQPTPRLIGERSGDGGLMTFRVVVNESSQGFDIFPVPTAPAADQQMQAKADSGDQRCMSVDGGLQLGNVTAVWEQRANESS